MRRGWKWMSSLVVTKRMSSTQSFPRVIDTHCHLHDDRLRSHLGDVLRRAQAVNVTHVSTCACYEDDWRALNELLHNDSLSSALRSITVLPSFGIHPWWANTTSTNYLTLLRSQLVTHPTALIGEIGLCKSARGKQVDVGIQERILREQLQLAAELQRGCVIHCVGMHGKMLEILQHQCRTKAIPPVIILHSYSGPAELVAAFLALECKPHGNNFKVFFSMNAKHLARAANMKPVDSNAASMKLSKSEAACAVIPLDALLLETDAPDQVPTIQNEFKSELQEHHGLNEPALVHLALQGAAAIRCMPVGELAEIVYDNACRAFGLEKEIIA